MYPIILNIKGIKLVCFKKNKKIKMFTFRVIWRTGIFDEKAFGRAVSATVHRAGYRSSFGSTQPAHLRLWTLTTLSHFLNNKYEYFSIFYVLEKDICLYSN